MFVSRQDWEEHQTEEQVANLAEAMVAPSVEDLAESAEKFKGT